MGQGRTGAERALASNPLPGSHLGHSGCLGGRALRAPRETTRRRLERTPQQGVRYRPVSLGAAATVSPSLDLAVHDPTQRGLVDVAAARDDAHSLAGESVPQGEESGESGGARAFHQRVRRPEKDA